MEQWACAFEFVEQLGVLEQLVRCWPFTENICAVILIYRDMFAKFDQAGRTCHLGSPVAVQFGGFAGVGDGVADLSWRRCFGHAVRSAVLERIFATRIAQILS